MISSVFHSNLINAGIETGKKSNIDFVIGFGGGAVIDTAKAVAALMTNPGELKDYLEVIGRGHQIQHHPLPLIAVPTTAGPGTEVTRNAVVLSPEHHIKVSMRSPMMIPDVAIIDPELTYSMPPPVTASTGMDALTQCIEAYVSNNANPLTDGFAKQGIVSAAKSLQPAYHDGQNRKARRGMCLASLCGGLSLANSGLGAVHGFAGVIGGMFNAPHGEVCASLLPAVMKYNIISLSEKRGMDEIIRRYHEIAVWLTGNPKATIPEGIKWIKSLTEELSIPYLRKLGISQKDFDEIIEKSIVSSSMQKNPVKLSESSLLAILTESF